LLATFNEIDMSAVKQLRPIIATRSKRNTAQLAHVAFRQSRDDASPASPTPKSATKDRLPALLRHRYRRQQRERPGRPGASLRRSPQLRRNRTSIDDFGKRASTNKLDPADLEGGTFTITNGGTFGSLLSTPIVNPPQSGVLGMHAIQDRPVAREGQVVIRPMMYVALTYDHRLVDGRDAVTF
jgi:2-oxoglutarate dehydrogenase E2 component (dihydrolipoamide succinyltransferase)